MGTRADFYTLDKRNKFTWLGSIAYDGYPSGLELPIFKAKTIQSFKKEVNKFFNERMETCTSCKGSGADPTGKYSICMDCPTGDVTFPNEGWPWPWETSETTDYAYIFDAKAGRVLISGGGGWTYTLHEHNKYDKFYEAYEKRDDKNEEEPEFDEWLRVHGKHRKRYDFPDMKIVPANIFRGNKSGIMVMGVKK